MKNHSNLKARIANAKTGGDGKFVSLIADGQDEAVHTLRFVSAKIEKSKKNNVMAVLKCKLKKRGDKDLHDKDENLYFLLDHPDCSWQMDQLLAVVAGLGVDLNRIDEDDLCNEDVWNDIFEDMSEFSGNIDFKVTYKFQYEKNGDKKKGYDKRVDFDEIKAISWPKGTPAEDVKSEDAAEDNAEPTDGNEDDTP